jgi:hypothetical protein
VRKSLQSEELGFQNFNKFGQKRLRGCIGEDEGMYYGEWKEVDSYLKIEGRGALICTDKVILGYTIDGMWADRSP